MESKGRFLKDNKSWMRTQPPAADRKGLGIILIVPVRRKVEVPSLDRLSRGFDDPVPLMAEERIKAEPKETVYMAD